MLNVYDRDKNGSLVSSDAILSAGVRIGPFCVVGYPTDPRASLTYEAEAPVLIGDDTVLESFVILENGASIGRNVTLDHYVRVGGKTSIGDGTYLLYGTRVHRNVRIGSNCRISGNCPDGTVIGNDVTHFGRIHHRYDNPFGSWETTNEAAPIIRDRCVIAAGATVIGPVEIGANTYVAANEVVRQSLPSSCVYYKGKIILSADWRGSLAKNYFRDDH